MSEEQLKELQEYNLEYLEAQQSEEIFGGDYTSAVELKHAKKEIERLNKKIEQYENPEDMTLMFMWCDEKAKDEIKRLNNIINTILDFDFFKEECPLNFGYTEKCDEEKAQDVFYEDDYCEENCNDDYKKCWLKYFKKLQELKGSDKK